MLGTTLDGRYKITKLLGGGGFGQTFFAQDIKLPGNPLCVVKQLQPQSNDPYTLKVARRLFDTEAEVLHKLGEHDQIPRLLAHFEHNQQFYLVQQLIDGHDLTQEITPGKCWSETQVITLLKDVLTTLTFVHAQQVIHRDLKPANLIRRNQDSKIVLIDFGAVKEVSTQVVNSPGKSSLTVGIGTPGYMPNEQANGKPRFVSDVYALGMIAIEALTGLSPARGQISENPQTGEIIWREYAQVSPKLANVLDKMVRYDFRQRYQSASEVLQALPQQQSLWTRRDFNKVAGFAGLGLFGSLVISQIFKVKSPEAQSSPKNTKTPVLPKSSPSPENTRNTNNLSLQSFSFDVVTVNNQGTIINRRRNSAQFFSEDLGNGVTLEMVSIPGGTFLMGSPETEKERDSDETPQHSVTVKPFYMGKFTVTQSQWRAVAALSQINISLKPDPSKFKGDNLPVEQISWDEAVEFCARLSQKTGRRYRLPSEAEWEYSCRAGTTTPFHFGETITTDLVNYDGNYTYASAPKGIYRQKTTPVGSFQVANAFGLYDMHGNVWEWCADVWHENYTGAPSDGSVWESGADNTSRLLRGGSLYDFPWYCRSALRGWGRLVYRFYGFGFRVAYSLLPGL